MEIKGYKVFDSHWACRGKQYTCPGTFEEDCSPILCKQGMHFCMRLIDCFNYYRFNPYNKVAEVVAYGEIVSNFDKSCTNKLKIVRELSWKEVLELVNIGRDCEGLGNTGNYNTGDFNTHNYNSGNYNSGHNNSGDSNTGSYNSGHYNVGLHNSGNCNTGNHNYGSANTGDFNIGHSNSGKYNNGTMNTGSYNMGSYNSGDYNTADYSNGFFNTKEVNVYMFNKPSNWTIHDWWNSPAKKILADMPKMIRSVSFCMITDEEKNARPDAKITNGYIKVNNIYEVAAHRQRWWNNLTKRDKATVMALPNFDSEIFKEITGIEVRSN